MTNYITNGVVPIVTNILDVPYILYRVSRYGA